MDKSEQPLWTEFESASYSTFSLQVNLKDGTVLSLPGYVVRGKEPGPTLYVHASQHGTELNGIKAILEIVAWLKPQELSGTVVAVPVANPLAIRSRSYLPEGEPNANRAWPGDPNGENVQRIVYALYDNLVRHADAVLDYHGINDRYASSIWIDKSESDVSMQMAKAFGLPCIVGVEITVTKTPITPGVRINSLDLGIPIVCVEPRGEMVTRDDSVQELKLGAYNVMRWLKMLPGTPQKPPFRTGRHKVELKASMEGLYYPEVEPGALVGEGTLLGKLVSFSTLEVEEIRAPMRGFVYMNGRYEADLHTLNDIVNEGETIVILMEVMPPDAPSWPVPRTRGQPSVHGLAPKEEDTR